MTVSGFAALLALPGASGSSALAAFQQNQPIYPVYDGYLKNPDGSYTLSFAYFSHNANEVTVQPGVNNSFAPAPGSCVSHQAGPSSRKRATTSGGMP